MRKLKKIKYLLFVLISGLFLNTKALAQTQRPFKFFPAVLKQGDDVKTVYKPLSGTGTVTGVVYLFKDYKWEGHDLPLTKTDTGYVANYHIPEGTALMSYRFWIGDSVDVGGRIPYAFMIHEKDGKKMASGANTEWGLLRFKDLESKMMPLVSKESEIELSTLIRLWIGKDFDNVQIRRHVFFDMARCIKTYIKVAKADTGLRQAGDAILNLPDVNEREMITVEKVYGRILQKPLLADSVKKLTLAKYPDGLRKRLLAIDSIYLDRTPADKVKMLETFLKRYPASKYPFDDYIDPAIGDPRFFFSAYNGVVNYLFFQKQFDAMKQFITEGPYRLVNYDYAHFVDFPFRATSPPITTDEQLDLSKFMMNDLMRRAVSNDPQVSGRGYFSQVEWKRIIIQENRWSIAFHANLLYVKGDFSGALKYANIVKTYLGYSDIKFNDLYIHLLDHDHKDAETKRFMEEAIKVNKADPEVIALFKTYYIKDHHSDKGFEAYFDSLSPVKQTEALHERLKNSLIKLPAGDFKLKNLQGEEVDLQKQKGKIVVLDFWASWCFPCKQAMPGMETLVKKYKADTTMQFYFIATLEQSPNYKKLITDFIADQKYDFNVLYDDNDPKTGKMGLVFNSYARQLHMNGIPQKVIIDQNGFVRWVYGGFDGDLVAMTKEVDYVISLIKQEK